MAIRNQVYDPAVDPAVWQTQAQSLAKVLRVLAHAQSVHRSSLAPKLTQCAVQLEALADKPGTSADLKKVLRAGLRLGERATKHLQREAAGNFFQRIGRRSARHEKLTDPVRLATILLTQLRQQEQAIAGLRQP